MNNYQFDINSREELQELADAEGITINWDKWQELVNSTKKDIRKKMTKLHQPSKKVTVFVIDLKKPRVENIFHSTKECADFYNIRREQVTRYARENRVYYKKMIQFIIIE